MGDLSITTEVNFADAVLLFGQLNLAVAVTTPSLTQEGMEWFIPISSSAVQMMDLSTGTLHSPSTASHLTPHQSQAKDCIYSKTCRTPVWMSQHLLAHVVIADRCSAEDCHKLPRLFCRAAAPPALRHPTLAQQQFAFLLY